MCVAVCMCAREGAQYRCVGGGEERAIEEQMCCSGGLPSV